MARISDEKDNISVLMLVLPNVVKVMVGLAHLKFCPAVFLFDVVSVLVLISPLVIFFSSSSHSVFDGVSGSVWCFGSVHLIGGLLSLLGQDSDEALTTMKWKDDDLVGDRDVPMKP